MAKKFEHGALGGARRKAGEGSGIDTKMTPCHRSRRALTASSVLLLPMTQDTEVGLKSRQPSGANSDFMATRRITLPWLHHCSPASGARWLPGVKRGSASETPGKRTYHLFLLVLSRRVPWNSLCFESEIHEPNRERSFSTKLQDPRMTEEGRPLLRHLLPRLNQDPSTSPRSTAARSAAFSSEVNDAPDEIP